MDQELPLLEVIGRPNASDLDWYTLLTWYQGHGGPTGAPSGGTGGAVDAFAPPAPLVLPEVIVTAPKPKPAPPPPVTVTEAITSVLGRIVSGVAGLLVPLPAGPQARDEAPILFPRTPGITASPMTPTPIEPQLPLEVLPEVKVSPPRRPPVMRPPTAEPADPFPFNLDPLEYYPELPGQRPLVPLPGDQRRPGTVRVGDPGLFGAPDFAREIAPVPRPRQRPLPAPGAPFLVPFTTPSFTTGPGIDLGPQSLPRPGISPRAEPRPLPAPRFLETPVGDPFVDLAPRSPPRAAPAPTPRPVLFDAPIGMPGLDPLPLEEPRPGEADRCSCTKEKKKKPKKRKPRAVCYRGSYTETSNSLRKVRREQIPCT